ncbi:MAG: GNAT family N-acetyltransferase [Chloroflexi bacterium AL-W]|nr:GNAT family N-acetyltransferase [Chloroflexi bacterium AL-W]
MTVVIRDMHTLTMDSHEQAAHLLHAGFAEHWPDAWPDVDSAMEEVLSLLEEDCICLAALDEEGEIVGWIGGLPEYDGHVFELHPLVVQSDQRGQGIGRLLVLALEDHARQAGANAIMLGTDDQNEMTSLSGVNLYPNVWEHISNIQNYKNHPYSFYQKLGYTIVGVIPDANGPGKPDILMAKSL